MNSRSLFAALSAAAALALLAGCSLLPEPQPDRARYYRLDVISGTSGAETAPAGAPRLGLRPIEVPAYLKNKAIATRAGDNEIRYAADAFWAEPLEAGLGRAFRERLAKHAVVIPYPFPAQMARDYDVTVRVLAAEGSADGLRFSAVVDIVRVGDHAALIARRELTAAPANWNGDYAQLARALEASTGAFADAIIASLPKQ